MFFPGTLPLKPISTCWIVMWSGSLPAAGAGGVAPAVMSSGAVSRIARAVGCMASSEVRPSYPSAWSLPERHAGVEPFSHARGRRIVEVAQHDHRLARVGVD